MNATGLETCKCGAKVNALGRDQLGGVHPGKACLAGSYVAANVDGSYDAFVKNAGFTARRTLPEATAFIRQHTGRQYGAVRCLNRQTREWDSEIEIKAGA